MSDRSVSKRSQEKRWYTVLAPEQFDRAELGTTPAIEPEQVLDRTIETTLGDVMEGGENNVKLTFQVTDVGSDSAYTEFARHELTRAVSLGDQQLPIEAMAHWYAQKLDREVHKDEHDLLDFICRTGIAGVQELREKWEGRSKSQIQWDIIR